MIVIPLIMSSLIFNIAKFENVEGLSLLSIKTIILYFIKFCSYSYRNNNCKFIPLGYLKELELDSVGLNNKSEIDLIINSQNNIP